MRPKPLIATLMGAIVCCCLLLCYEVCVRFNESRRNRCARTEPCGRVRTPRRGLVSALSKRNTGALNNKEPSKVKYSSTALSTSCCKSGHICQQGVHNKQPRTKHRAQEVCGVPAIMYILSEEALIRTAAHARKVSLLLINQRSAVTVQQRLHTVV
jgi:hypothetical protein